MFDRGQEFILKVEEHHRSDLVRLRIVKSPFAFLCFLAGRTGGYFVWETLGGADATYIWKHAKPVDYLVSRKPEFKRWLAQTEGRNEYLQEKHENFTRIIHNYQNEDGFLKIEE